MDNTTRVKVGLGVSPVLGQISGQGEGYDSAGANSSGAMPVLGLISG